MAGGNTVVLTSLSELPQCAHEELGMKQDAGRGFESLKDVMQVGIDYALLKESPCGDDLKIDSQFGRTICSLARYSRSGYGFVNGLPDRVLKVREIEENPAHIAILLAKQTDQD